MIDPLSTALLAILKDKDENRGANENENGNGNGEMEERQGQEQGQSMMEQASRAVGVLLFFCQVAQADARVREAFATRTVMMRMLPILLFPKACAYLISDSHFTFFHPKLQCDSILKTLNTPPHTHRTQNAGLLKACDLLPRKLLVTAIKSIKHLSTSPQLIEVLQNSNAMEILVDLLGKSIKGSHSNVRPISNCRLLQFWAPSHPDLRNEFTQFTGDLLKYLPNYLLYDTSLQIPTRRSCI